VSFLVDPPLLVGSGAMIERHAPSERSAETLSRILLAGFLVTSISLYLNLRWTRWIWKLCRAESGRDWMLNSGVLSLEHERPSLATHIASAVIFASYPAWLRLGRSLARRPEQQPSRPASS
jgi:hypothetical protein